MARIGHPRARIAFEFIHCLALAIDALLDRLRARLRRPQHQPHHGTGDTNE